MPTNTTIGQRIRAARVAAGMSQDQFADAIGMTKTTVSNWERDVMNPRVDLLASLRKVLDVSLDHLICGDANDAIAKHWLQVAETPATYGPISLSKKEMRTQRMARVFAQLNEHQQKSVIDVASNMAPPSRAATPRRAVAPETEKQK